MKANEERWRQRLLDEEKKHKDLTQRMIREKTLELDSANLRLQIVEKDHSTCNTERQKLLNDVDVWRKKCSQLENDVKDYQDELSEARKEGKEHQSKTWRSKEETDRRLKESLSLVEELK